MSMTISGHSVKTRKDVLDFGDSLATGEVDILGMVGLGVATTIDILFCGVVVSEDPASGVDPSSGVVLSDVDSSPAKMASISMLVLDLGWISEGGTVAKAGNRKLRWTEVGKVL